MRYPWLATRTELLPLGYDPVVFSVPPQATQPVQGRIICVASWSPVKGHDLLLDALSLLVQRGRPLHLLLVGERTDGPEARAAVAQRGLEARVLPQGALPQPEVAALLRTAQVAVITSWHEAQCLAVVEALACGTPVISTPVGIARELLRDPVRGTCVPTRSPTALADALETYLCRVPPGNAHARQARQQAVAHLALPRVAERFLDIYRELSACNTMGGTVCDVGA
jgi:glycosyltransferase involved in cell wall biosynthesis